MFAKSISRQINDCNVAVVARSDRNALRPRRTIVLVSVASWVAFGGAGNPHVLANSSPEVTNVTAYHDTFNKFVYITYDLADADGDQCFVTIRASDNYGLTWDLSVTSIGGAVGGGIIPGTGKNADWWTHIDIPYYRGDVVVGVFAEDGTDYGMGVSPSFYVDNGEKKYWVGYQSSCGLPPFPSLASFFDGDNWSGMSPPGAHDGTFLGSGVDAGFPGWPMEIFFGNSCLMCPPFPPRTFPGRDAESYELRIQDGSFTFHFGWPGMEWMCPADPPPPDRTLYTVWPRIYIGDTVESTGLPGNAQLTITGNGELYCYEGSIGYGNDNFGRLVVDGSNFSAHWFIGVGYDGYGEIEVLNGGYLGSGASRLGLWRGGFASVRVSGLGSTWVNTPHWLYVGDPPYMGSAGCTASLTIDDSGTVMGSPVYLWGKDTRLTIDGAGSTLYATDFLHIGYESLPGGKAIATLLNGGRINVEGDVTIGSHGDYRLVGNGVVNAGNVENSGKVAPGLPPDVGGTIGLLTITGDFTNTPDGTLEIEVGPWISVCDQLIVSGAANLAGTLDLRTLDFFPSSGDSFGILSYGARNGEFQTIVGQQIDSELRWALDYAPTGLTIIACNPVINPSCDDCNLNGVLDGRDIALGTSLDANLDGIPDECIKAMSGANWSDPIWGLGTPAPYPDNINPNAAPNRHVTLASPIDLFLDVSIQVDSLRLLNGSTLRATQTGAGDLGIKSPGNMLIEGHLFVAHDRVVTVSSGAVTVGPGGTYMKDPSTAARGGTTSASLFAAGLILNSCSIPCLERSVVDLAQSMSATVNGDLVMNGVLAGNGHCESSLEGGVAGGYTPPIVRVKDQAWVNILGNVLLMGAANFIVNPTVQSTASVTIGGNFDNRSLRPDCFSCRNGGFLLNSAAPQFFEVAGTDIGTVGSVDRAEFVIGALEVGAGCEVTFRNAFDNNGLGQGPCEEALYVEKLTLAAGSTVVADNCRVYYETLDRDPSAMVTLVGCGEVLPVVSQQAPPTPGSDPTGLNKGRSISFLVPGASTAVAGETALRVKLVALHHVDPHYTGGASVPFTFFEGQSMYVGPPTQYVESASSGIPFYASQLQCAPYYQDWSTVGLLHMTGEAIVPSSDYEVQNLAASCAGNESSCTAVSAPLEIKTARWGDVETPYQDPGGPLVTQPDTSDISALVNKFKSALGAPIKSRALLAGSTARGTITKDDIAADVGFTHISLCVDSFKGLPYPYRPGKCTGNEYKACISDSDCAAQSTGGPCVLCP